MVVFKWIIKGLIGIIMVRIFGMVKIFWIKKRKKENLLFNWNRDDVRWVECV